MSVLCSKEGKTSLFVKVTSFSFVILSSADSCSIPFRGLPKFFFLAAPITGLKTEALNPLRKRSEKLFSTRSWNGEPDRCIPSHFFSFSFSFFFFLSSVFSTFASKKETLRCLALATRDKPLDVNKMDLTDAQKFSSYEV